MMGISTAVKTYRYAFAIYTDHVDFILDKTAELQEEKLLEIRCFDERGEFRACRSVLDAPFSVREIVSTAGSAVQSECVFAENSFAGWYDEAQYLDIDAARTKAENNGWTYTTGGGRLHLPDEAARNGMVLVRFFYRFDTDGVARKADWRLVGFTDTETVGKEGETWRL